MQHTHNISINYHFFMLLFYPWIFNLLWFSWIFQGKVYITVLPIAFQILEIWTCTSPGYMTVYRKSSTEILVQWVCSKEQNSVILTSNYWEMLTQFFSSFKWKWVSMKGNNRNGFPWFELKKKKPIIFWELKKI